jgi:hypothetical protein
MWVEFSGGNLDYKFLITRKKFMQNFIFPFLCRFNTDPNLLAGLDNRIHHNRKYQDNPGQNILPIDIDP